MSITILEDTTALTIVGGLFLVAILILALLIYRGRRRRTTSSGEQGEEGLSPAPEAPADDQKDRSPFTGRPPHAPIPTGTDPVEAMVTTLMNGEGELTEAESRRVRLYKPERVISVALAKSESVSGRNQDVQRARLSRIRHLAESQQAEVSSPDETGVVEEEAPDTGVETIAGGEETIAGEEEAEADAPLAGSEEETAEPAPEEAEETVEAAEEPAGPADAFVLEEELSFSDTEEVTEVSGELSEADEESLEEDSWDDMDMEWETESREAEVMEVTEAEVEPTEPTESELEPLASDHLNLDISRAQDVFRLPENERVDALSFLEESELLAVIRQDEGGPLSLAAIDTLGNLGTPEALTVLQECLEEPSQEVQMRAVETVERLLKDN